MGKIVKIENEMKEKRYSTKTINLGVNSSNGIFKFSLIKSNSRRSKKKETVQKLENFPKEEIWENSPQFRPNSKVQRKKNKN